MDIYNETDYKKVIKSLEALSNKVSDVTRLIDRPDVVELLEETCDIFREAIEILKDDVEPEEEYDDVEPEEDLADSVDIDDEEDDE